MLDENDLKAKIDKTVHAVQSFTNLLDQETYALQKADYAAFAKLQENKLRLAQNYQQALLDFEEDLPHLSQMNESLKAKLRAIHAHYAQAVEANQKALLAAKNVTERIVKLIMNAAKQTVMDGPSYSAAGLQTLSEKIPIHFKLNEVL
jgi:hypothetical protein